MALASISTERGGSLLQREIYLTMYDMLGSPSSRRSVFPASLSRSPHTSPPPTHRDPPPRKRPRRAGHNLRQHYLLCQRIHHSPLTYRDRRDRRRPYRIGLMLHLMQPPLWGKDLNVLVVTRAAPATLSLPPSPFKTRINSSPTPFG